MNIEEEKGNEKANEKVKKKKRKNYDVLNCYISCCLYHNLLYLSHCNRRKKISESSNYTGVNPVLLETSFVKEKIVGIYSFLVKKKTKSVFLNFF